MPRTIHTFLPLEGDPGELIEIFLGEPAQWLPDARHAGPDHWELHVAAGPVERSVEVTVGSPWRVGGTWWRALSWRPLPEDHDPVAVERLLPALDAEVGLVQDASGRLTLALDGRYSAPGGRIGGALDAVGLRRVARHTMERLLASIAQRMTAAAQAEQPPASAEQPPA
jgi:hypothetical protein